MNRDTVIRLAREAGLVTTLSSIDSVERFAALVAQHEREACAKVCDEQDQAFTASPEYATEWTPSDCAAAIRSRT